MHANPGHPAWRRVPLAVIALFVVVTGIAVYDLTVNGNQGAWTGIIMAPLGAAAWTWVYRQVRSSR